MNATAYFCPNCLAMLPPDYEFDHVAIDLAMAGNTAVVRRMPREERAELVRVGRDQGLEDYEIAARVHRSVAEVRNWLANPTVQPRSHTHDDQVRALWEQGLSDRQISIRLHISKATAREARARQQLPALFTRGGLRRTVVAA
jgi:hypothetical protein